VSVNWISAGGLALCAAALTAAAPAPKPSTAKPPAKLQQLMQSCDAHKFETIVDTTEDGKPHKSRVKLCGVEGQSDSDWIGTLKDAIAKLDSNKDMDPAVRDQIVTAIRSEISRIEGTLPGGDSAAAFNLAPAPQKMANLDLPPARPIAPPERPLSSDYATLPQIPTTPPPPPRVLAPGAVMNASSAVALHLGPAPKLSYQCYSPGDVGDAAPCTEFDRETMLTISAASDVAKGVALQFVRNGDQRGEVELAGLKRGKSLQIALPESVCEGFTDGRLDLKIVEQGAELKSDGPYSLRC
jgi:hypothetical protein